MRYLLTLTFVLSSLVVSLDAQTRRPRPRTVIRGELVGPKKELPPKAADDSIGAVVENWISDYNLNADGTGTEIRTMQQRCFSELCVKRFESFSQPFNGDLQKLRVLDAYILKADGSRVKTPATAITDRPTDQTEAAPGFSSMRQIDVKFDGLKVGDAMYLKLETVTTRPTFDGKFDSLEMFPVLFDWKSIEINVSAPADFPLFIEAVGLDGGKLPDESGRSRWKYKKLNVEKIAIEPVMYDVITISPRFALTSFGDANALGSAFWDSLKRKAVVTPEIQTLADEITKDAKTPTDQAAAIYEWVNKNIRYLSIVLDRGGWIPHSSAEIIKNGYGDCKDYTTIIHTLLKAKGIDSTPVLIRSDFGDWFPSVPTADYFNHAILYIPSLNVFADATTPNTRLGLIPQTLVGKRAVLAGEKTGIIQLPKDDPSQNQILSEMKMDFAENGSVKTRTRNTFAGRAEMIFRPLFSEQVRKEGATFVKILLAYIGLNGEGSIVNVADPHKVGEPFSVEIESRIDNFTTFIPKGRLQIPPGLNMISMASLEALTGTESRKTNISVGASKTREVLSINLPATVKISTPPPTVSFVNGIGSFTAVPEVKDGNLTYTRELIITKDVVEPKEYPLLKDLIARVGQAGSLDVEYAADSSLLKAKSKELRKSPAIAPLANEEAIYDRLIGDKLPKKLTIAEVRQMEARLKTNPTDVETRLALIRHYSLYDPRRNPQNEAARVQHRIWLINNRPEISDHDVYGLWAQELSATALELVKNAWLAKVKEAKDSSAVRINAIASLKSDAPEVALTLAEEGAALQPGDYRFPLMAAEIGSKELENAVSGESAQATARKVLEHGKRALSLIKKERSDDRDSDRASLLKYLCAASIKLDDLDGATAFAQELVLDFGQSSSEAIYDEVSHVGNTTLGLVAIRRNDIPKAKEHLLASIRAPLRKDYTSLAEVDTRLASELYDRGEKAVVSEYLKLCLDLGNFKKYPESYADEIKALKLWQDQIAKGVRPSFDFKKP